MTNTGTELTSGLVKHSILLSAMPGWIFYYSLKNLYSIIFCIRVHHCDPPPSIHHNKTNPIEIEIFSLCQNQMATVPVCGIMINVVAPKWNSIWALSYIAKHWPVKTAIKRKKRDLFLLFSHTDRAFVVLCGQMAPKLNQDILVLSGCFSGLLYMTEDYCKSALETSQAGWIFALQNILAFVVCPYGGGYCIKFYLFVYILTTGSI